jgi:hypothetical protein
MQAHDNLIQLVLSLSYASNEELGYDMTMRLFKDSSGTHQYEIDVGLLTFVSSQVLSDLATDRLCGRATRVFKVSEKTGSLRHFALKDQWIDDDRKAEWEVLGDLHALIKSQKEEGVFDDMHLPKDPVGYFLSVKAHSQVRLSTASVDNTKTTIMRGYSLPESYSALSLPLSEKNVAPSEVPGVSRDSAGHIPYPIASIALILPMKRVHHPRRHDRIVFNEVGTPLHDLNNFSDLFRGLADATTGRASVDSMWNMLLISLFDASSRNYPPIKACSSRYKHRQYLTC